MNAVVHKIIRDWPSRDRVIGAFLDRSGDSHVTAWLLTEIELTRDFQITQ